MRLTDAEIKQCLDVAWNDCRRAEMESGCTLDHDKAFFMCNHDTWMSLRRYMRPEAVGLRFEQNREGTVNVIRMFGYRVVLVLEHEANLGSGFLFVQVPLG